MFYFILSILILTFSFDLWLSILNYKNRHTTIPEEVNDVYDLSTYHKWLNYSMENYRIGMLSKIVSFILTFCFLIFGFFPYIHNMTQNITSNIYLQTLLFIGLYFVIELIIDIPFSYYQQFSIEAKYGFNRSTKKTFIIDQIKSLLLTVILGGGFIFLITFLYYRVGNLFYLLTWISIILIMLFINLFYVKLFVPIFNKLSPLEEGTLKDKIVHFTNTVGYEITRISVIDSSKRTTKLNAFFSGLGRYKQVVLYDSLLQKMNDEQIVSVLAHEIGHSKHKHILKNLFISIITITIYLLVLLFSVKSQSLSMDFGFNNVHFGFGLLMFSILISPLSILFDVITSYISRQFEYEADHFASIHGYKLEMEESLKILARENYANLTPHPLYVALRYSHPPISKRIIAIRKIN